MKRENAFSVGWRRATGRMLLVAMLATLFAVVPGTTVNASPVALSGPAVVHSGGWFTQINIQANPVYAYVDGAYMFRQGVADGNWYDAGYGGTNVVMGFTDTALLVAGGVGVASKVASASKSSASTATSATVAANSADDFVNLASPARTQHILDGELRPNGSFGGGHRSGTGYPGKSEFPADWSDGKIMDSISDVATDPSLVWRTGNKPGDFFVGGTRGGVDIEVLVRNNQIWTAYPTNVMRNAP